MSKLTVDEFDEYEDGDYSNAGLPHWISIRSSPRGGDYSVRVSSSDWYDEELGRGTTVDSASGFDTREEALQWGVDCVNDIPLRLAAWSLEAAFASMAEWLPLVVPFVAQAVAAEREAIRAEVERRRSTESAACGDPSTQSFIAGFVARELSRVLAWIDARSKGGAR